MIAIDIDGCICDFMTPFTRACKEMKIPLDNTQYKGLLKCTQKQTEDAGKIIDILMSDQLKYLKPYKGVEEALNKMWVKYGTITYLTARREAFIYETHKWLMKINNHFFRLITKSSSDKVPFLVESGHRILIEDRLRTANEAAEAGLRTYLIKRPWNTGREIHKNITVINSLEEV